MTNQQQQGQEPQAQSQAGQTTQNPNADVENGTQSTSQNSEAGQVPAGDPNANATATDGGQSVAQ